MPYGEGILGILLDLFKIFVDFFGILSVEVYVIFQSNLPLALWDGWDASSMHGNCEAQITRNKK